MGKFKKYEFDSEAQADEYINNLTDQDEEGNDIAHGNHIIKLGFITISPEKLYKNGNVKKEAVINNMYSVDVVWMNKKDKDWKAFRIKLKGKPSSHEIFGLTYSDDTE